MNLKLSKVTYIASILFLISLLQGVIPSTFNWRVLLYFLFSILIIKDIFNANRTWFYAKSKLSQIRRGLYLYFLGHPILISILTFFGIGGLAPIAYSSIILSGANMTLQVLIGIYFIVKINYKNYSQIKIFVSLFAWIFLLEYTFASIFAANYAFYFDKFIGFIHDEWLISLFALLSFHFSITDYLITKKLRYIIFSFAFLLLGYVCKMRIFFLAIFIYIILSLFMMIKNKFNLLIFTTLTFIITYFVVMNIGLNNEYFETLYDRFYLFGKQIDLIKNNLIFGVGGNVSEKYYQFTSPALVTNIIEILNLELLSSIFDINQNLDLDGYFLKRSSHSTLLDIIGEYGVLGIYVSFFSISWPLNILRKMRKLYSSKIIDIELRQSAIIFISLLGFYLLLSSGQFIWVAMLLLAYLIYLYKIKLNLLNNLSQ